MLFACMYASDFMVQAALWEGRAGPHTMLAVAVVDGPESLLKVVAGNAAARKAGVQIGMTRMQAEASPGATVRKRSPEQEQAAQAALLHCGYDFSPRLESTAMGTVIVDLTGTERLLGTHAAMGRYLVSRAKACGLAVNVGLAGNPDSALHAARGFAGVTVIAPGRERLQLAGLPVEVLQPDAEILDTLDSWGIRDFKSLAALPEIPLTQRLGQKGLYLQRLAKGEVQRELVAAELPSSFDESMELEEPVELLEPLAFVLNRLLEQLMARLRERSLATDHVRVDLKLEIHHDREVKAEVAREPASPLDERTLKMPVPTQDAKVLLKLVQLDLEAHPPQGPVRKATVEAWPARMRAGQGGLFQPTAPEPAKLEVTLARLRAVAGEKDERGRGCVGFPQVLDSHQPDSFQVLPSMPEDKEAKAKEIGECRATPSLALRRFRPPIGARVEMSSDEPTAIIFGGVRAKVRNASGPWRISGGWWELAAQWQRDEWDVEISMEGGPGLYKIFREVRSGQWFVEGMYD